FVSKLPKKKKSFEHGELAFGEVVKDKAFLRELIRNIQVLRKKERLNVKERINLWLGTDKKTEKVLGKNRDWFSKEVGASKVRMGIPKKFKPKGSLEFEKKKVKIYFERAKK
ncbi:MAG: hypothetical protein JSV39_01425, partial [Candidatus Aenigmatarchaeota archaeon]